MNTMKSTFDSMIEARVEARAMELLREMLEDGDINSGTANGALSHVQRGRFQASQSVADVAAIRQTRHVSPSEPIQRRRGTRTVEYVVATKRGGNLVASADDITAMAPSVRATFDVIRKAAGKPLTHPVIAERANVKLKSAESTIYQLKAAGFIVAKKIAK